LGLEIRGGENIKNRQKRRINNERKEKKEQGYLSSLKRGR